MEIKYISQDNYKEEVLQAQVPVLMDIWAPWCGPCKMLMPVLEEISKETDAFQIVKVNADEEPDIVSEYKVSSIPTLIVVKDGKEVNRSVGLISKEAILKLIEA